jgi:hypothetical protein
VGWRCGIVSADGDLLVVTSQNDDTNRVQAYQLSTDEPQMWIPYGQELTGTGNQYEHYGADLALSVDGKILAVGAPGNIDQYNSKLSGKSISSLDKPFISGRIYMYQLITDEVNLSKWTRIDHGELVSSGEGDRFGISVSFSAGGSIVVGGAPRRTGKAYQHILGGVHVYHASH